MNLTKLLQSVHDGKLSIEQAEQSIAQWQKEQSPWKTEDIGIAKLDVHREQRTGFPEVIYGEFKTDRQIISIFETLMQHTDRVIATRINEQKAKAICEALPLARYLRDAQIVSWRKEPVQFIDQGYVAIVCAGTTDLPVAEEAAFMTETMGTQVERIYDVGVSGLHRLFEHLELIRGADVIVVVAGMEGALVSVIGGLVNKPIIAVPTSIGYGAHFQGLAPLLAMLNSCAPGVTVVNIDNGFGAGYSAGLIHQNKYAK